MYELHFLYLHTQWISGVEYGRIYFLLKVKQANKIQMTEKRASLTETDVRIFLRFSLEGVTLDVTQHVAHQTGCQLGHVFLPTTDSSLN